MLYAVKQMIRKSIDKIRATNTQKKEIYERICADYEKNKKEEKKAGNTVLWRRR